jgi:hypothetical protein
MTSNDNQEQYPLDPRRDEKYARVYEISHSVQDIWDTLVRTGEIVINSIPDTNSDHEAEVATVTQMRQNNDREPNITLAQAEVNDALAA